MKNLRALFAVSFVVALLVAASAMAAPTITVSFGPNQDINSQAKTLNPFKIWVVMSNINDTVNAVEYKINLPAEVVVQDPGLFPGAIDLGSASTGSAIGLPACQTVYDVMGSQYDHLVVAEMTAIAVSDFPSFNVTVTPFTGSPQDMGTAPRYSNCDGVLTNLTPVSGTLSSSVPGESSSWSQVKALY
jgi:hypothetical protein